MDFFVVNIKGNIGALKYAKSKYTKITNNFEAL